MKDCAIGSSFRIGKNHYWVENATNVLYRCTRCALNRKSIRYCNMVACAAAERKDGKNVVLILTSYHDDGHTSLDAPEQEWQQMESV